ncbi:glutathione S-transferase [soil metagenome]
MKLYGGNLSPFARMANVTAHETGFGDRIEALAAPVSPVAENPDLASKSPLGKIPILVTDHGHAIFDSRVIIEYLCHISGNKTLIPDDGVKRFRVLTLQAIGQGVADAAVGYRYETATRPQILQWPEYKARLELRMTRSCEDLEANWTKDLAEVTAGSIAVACAYAYLSFRIPAFEWQKSHPKLAAFVTEFSKRPSMQKTPPG